MDLYDILLISNDSTPEQITKAYRKLAKIHHPDKATGDTEKFQQINYAYNILINEKTRLQYDNMKKPTKGKLITFLENWFKQKNNDNSYFKNAFNLSDKILENIINNIEAYDFNDILRLFNNHIIPKKKNDNSIDCSDSDVMSWDQNCCDYYTINNLPLKYHVYNVNNIKLNLKCTIDDISNKLVRKIKIKRKQDNDFIETTYYFTCCNPYIVFDNGGDNDGHLIIYLTLPDPYRWHSDSIYYMIDINLYEFIYGVNIKEFNITNWIPYKDGTIININYINEYIFCIKLNILYNDTPDNMKLLEIFQK